LEEGERMSEEGKKKFSVAKCGNCTMPKHTKYDYQDCKKE
jgi:hypothetical protein